MPMSDAIPNPARTARLHALLSNPLLRTSRARAAPLKCLVRYIRTDLASDSPVLRTPAAQFWVESLLWEHLDELLQRERGAAAQPKSASAANVVAALNFIHANFDQPLTVQNIADAIGVSLRCLQAAFRREMGTTPRTIVTDVRLQNARIRLTAAGPSASVKPIALECGFGHLGRFADLYQQAYGEAPSETLRGRRH